MRSRAAIFALSLFCAAAIAAAPLPVYDDALATGFDNWSWATVSSQTAVHHGGTSALRVDVSAAGWQAWFAHRNAGIDTSVYGELDLWLQGTAGKTVTVALLAGGAPAGNVVTVTLASSWTLKQIAFTSFGVQAGDAVDGVWVQDATGGAQTFWLDDIAFIERTTPPPPPPTINVVVDPTLDRRAISPEIYGVNFGTDAQMAAMHWPVRRWGGNSTTRYNWRVDTHSVGVDWFYFNYTNSDPTPPNLPDGSTADVFIDTTRAGGGQPIITVPLIGWTPIEDRLRRWSFPVSVYGPQQKTECSVTNNASWCNPDAGNGLTPGGTPLVPVPTRTSQPITASFVTDWMQHIAARVGTAAQGGVHYFALDNEPGLWNSSHRDVHPLPTTYDELWTKTVSIAAAVKLKDPNAKLLGPVSWGWCEYFFSAADGCSTGGDSALHGNEPWIDWYLDQAKAYETLHGTRLVDYLDLHYYPQNDGVALSDDETAGTAAVRLRSLKSLYDPTYVDESWIGTQIRMLPRMRDWVANHYPGTKLAITEYSWGNDNGLTSALAQAEALAIFGREGLDLATRWIAPAEGSLVEDAFKLYLDWNGTGAQVSGDSIRATSSNVDAVGAYAVERADGRRQFLLFNKDTRVRHVSVKLAAAALTRPASLVRFDGATRIDYVGNVSPVGGALELDLPARSATLAVIAAPASAPGSSFYTVPPCRALDTRNATGPYGGPQLAAAKPRGFVLGGRCGIPMDAVAVSANVTIVNASGGGSLQAYPGDLAPQGTSVLSYAAGVARANNAVFTLSADGKASIAVRPDVAAHLIIDVNGYFR